MDWGTFGTAIAQAAIVVIFIGIVYFIGTALVEGIRRDRDSRK